jgi:LysM repeat protein
MKKTFILLIILLILLSSLPSKKVSAKPKTYAITTASQLIEAVNGLRASYGLAPLVHHSILMQSAQSQADYMAATGNVTHSRPNGVTYTQQLISLGFPLAGDLSLGGFRAENILSTYGSLDWNGVPNGWEDSAHMNTMLSQNFTHIGAGVSQAGGSYYYAVDTAASTANGQMQSTSQDVLKGVTGSSGEAAGVSQFMVPITLSVAEADGRVFHKVEYGQTLWSIAVAYGTTIKNIQALNGLGEDLTIYQGQKLLVLQGATQSAPTAIEITATTVSTQVILPTATFPATPTMIQELVNTPTEETESNASTSSNSRILIIVLILAAFVGAGMAVWLIREPQ